MLLAFILPHFPKTVGTYDPKQRHLPTNRLDRPTKACLEELDHLGPREHRGDLGDLPQDLAPRNEERAKQKVRGERSGLGCGSCLCVCVFLVGGGGGFCLKESGLVAYGWFLGKSGRSLAVLVVGGLFFTFWYFLRRFAWCFLGFWLLKTLLVDIPWCLN